MRKNPYAARIAAEGLTVQVGRGRPKRLKGLTLHAALREAILAWARVA